MRRLALTALTLCLATALPASATRVATERYVGSGVVTLGQSHSNCPGDLVDEENIGEVCFHVDGDARVTLAIDDDVAPRVQAYYAVWGTDRAIVDSAFFCDATTIPLAQDATHITVSVGETLNVFCALQTLQPHAALAGTVTATFS